MGPASHNDSHTRAAYEEVLDRAMAMAIRLAPRPEAFEVAHEVASDLVRRGVVEPNQALLHRAVTYRLANRWRGANRRAATDRVYHDERTMGAAAWTDPSRELETRELAQQVSAAIAAMPDGMRRTFLLVRRDELSYKEAAERLGVGVGTVHTQLSRANAVLRQVVERYQRGDLPGHTLSGTQP